MTHLGSLKTTLAALLGAMVLWPATGSAITVDSSLNTSSAMLGQTTNISGEVVVMQDENTIGNNVVVTGSLPAGYTLSDVAIYPSLILGELSWNTYDETRLMTIDMRNGNLINGLQVILAGVPFPAQPCGIYGMDMHPLTGVYYALIGLQAPGADCEYAQPVRDLFIVDPASGIASWQGSPAVKLNGLVFGPTGQLFGHGSNGATKRGGLYKVSTADGSVASFVSSPIPDAAITWDYPAIVALNTDDGLIYHFYECQIATTNPTTGEQSTPVDANVCGSDFGWPNYHSPYYTSATYLGNNQFVLSTYSGYSWIVDVENLEWDYQFRTEYARGAVAAGLGQTLNASCSYAGNTFSCTLPHIVPLGAYTIEFDGDYVPGAVGDVPFAFSAGGAAGESLVTVVAADLAASASANVTQVDTANNVVWTVKAENLGTSAAASSQIVVNLPANQAYSTYTSTQGSCSHTSGVVTCNLGSVAGGNTATVTITTTAGTNGLSAVNASVSTSSAEASATNNTASARVVVGPAAELAVSASLKDAADAVTPPTYTPGKAAAVTVAITNAGPDDATNVKVTVPIPDNVTLSGTGCAAAGADLACDAGTIAVNASKTIELSVTAAKAGRHSLKVSAESSSVPDFDASNNTAYVSLDFSPPSVQVAVGPKSPRSGSHGKMAPVAQLVLTHGGQTDQALVVKSINVEGKIARLNQQSVRVLVINDVDGNGVKGDDEGVIGNGELIVNGDVSTISLSAGAPKLEKGASLTLLIVLRDGISTTQIASIGEGASMAALGILPIMLLFGLRRRKGLVVALFGFVMFGAAACTTEEAVDSAAIQVTITGVSAELIEGGPTAPVEGLPLALPTIEVE